MSLQLDLFGAPKGSSALRIRRQSSAPKRNQPYDVAPGYCELTGLWLFGNALLLGGTLGCVDTCFGPLRHMRCELDRIEKMAEELVLDAKVLVCGIHNMAHQRAAVVPLRWGSPRIVVLSGGFCHHLGENLKDEPFRAARLWRYEFDPKTDLVVSRRAPEKAPTFASHNPTVDRMVELIARGQWPGQSLFFDPPRLTQSGSP